LAYYQVSRQTAFRVIRPDLLIGLDCGLFTGFTAPRPNSPSAYLAHFQRLSFAFFGRGFYLVSASNVASFFVQKIILKSYRIELT
jgi:hypothetical protein